MWSESFDPLDDVKERNVGRSRQARKGKKKRATRSSVAIGQWVFHINCWMNGIAEKTKVSTRNGTFEGRNFLDQLDLPHNNSSFIPPYKIRNINLFFLLTNEIVYGV